MPELLDEDAHKEENINHGLARYAQLFDAEVTLYLLKKQVHFNVLLDVYLGKLGHKELMAKLLEQCKHYDTEFLEEEISTWWKKEEIQLKQFKWQKQPSPDDPNVKIDLPA